MHDKLCREPTQRVGCPRVPLNELFTSGKFITDQAFAFAVELSASEFAHAVDQQQ